MKVVSINHSPEEKKSAIAQLQDDLYDVISRFTADNGETPVCVVIGVLEFVKQNLIAEHA